MGKMFSKYSRLTNLFLFIMLFPMTLLWCEMFTRLLFPQNLDSLLTIFQTDQIIGYTYMPNVKTYETGREYNALYETNSLGLRDREYTEKNKGTFRVLLLGDSFAVSHGLPIEDSLSRQLEKMLQDNVDGSSMRLNIEVINAAIGGYSPYNYWRAYQRWAPIYKPDVVVVGLSPDDYDCGNENAKYWIEKGEIVAVYKGEQDKMLRRANVLRVLRKWLSRNSELYVLMRNYFYYNDIIGSLSQWLIAQETEQIRHLEPYMIPQSESMKSAWEKTHSYLRLIRQETVRDDIQMVVIPIPLKLEIDAAAQEKMPKEYGNQPRRVDIDQPINIIRSLCKEEGIHVLDPRAALRARNSEVRCYFVYDGHWVAEGIRVSVDSIVKQWRESKLPPWDKHSTYEMRNDDAKPGRS